MTRVQRGFTLLELIVALAIFGVFAALAYGGLRHTLQAQSVLTSHHDAIATLENAFVMVGKDLSNIVGRGARDALGGSVPALSAPPDMAAIEFTRYVNDDHGAAAAVQLKRIAYEVRNGALVRTTWPVLDRAQATVQRERIVLDGVASVAFRFHGEEWVGYWPAAQSNVVADVLPRAVEITVRFSDGNTARRIVMLNNQI